MQVEKKSLFFVLIAFPVVFLSFGCTNNLSSHGDITDVLPRPGEIHDWHPAHSPQVAVGEDLFLLINGGAEIYHEFGFRQAVMQQYNNNHNKSINIEIFEMTDSAAAFGMYSNKTGDAGEWLVIGDEACLEDYYLNFWKGHFIVTLTGFDSDPETRAGLMELAEGISAKIAGKGVRPPLIRLLPADNLKQGGITYFRGPLALFNSYGSLPNLRRYQLEGVMGDYGSQRIIILRYEDKAKSAHCFQAGSPLESDSSSPQSRTGRNLVSLTDDEGNMVQMALWVEYILLVIGSVPEESEPILSHIKEKIKQVENHEL